MTQRKRGGRELDRHEVTRGYTVPMKSDQRVGFRFMHAHAHADNAPFSTHV